MSNKYNLLLDAARLMHSLADVLAAIADTYADVKVLLTKYGASKLSDVALEHYEALMRDAEELGNE